jgi:hypothetical protein
MAGTGSSSEEEYMTLQVRTQKLIAWLGNQMQHQGISQENHAFCLLTKAYLEKLCTGTTNGRALGRALRGYHRHLTTHQHLLLNGAADYKESFKRTVKYLEQMLHTGSRQGNEA